MPSPATKPEEEPIVAGGWRSFQIVQLYKPNPEVFREMRERLFLPPPVTLSGEEPIATGGWQIFKK